MTALHVCFGYAAIIHGDRPAGYDCLAELAGTRVDQVSVETAQPSLDPEELRPLRGKHIMVGTIDLNDPAVETPQTVADRIRRAMEVVPVEHIIVAPDCGFKYVPRDIAFAKMQAMVEGAALVRETLR